MDFDIMVGPCRRVDGDLRPRHKLGDGIQRGHPPRKLACRNRGIDWILQRSGMRLNCCAARIHHCMIYEFIYAPTSWFTASTHLDKMRGNSFGGHGGEQRCVSSGFSQGASS